MTTAYISHIDCLKHEMIPGHPERPERLRSIEDQLIASRLFDLLRHYQAPRATMTELARVHDPRYLEALIAASPCEGLKRIDPDTFLSPHTIDAALRAAGAAVLAANLVLCGEVSNAFCNVRPPGHHATRGAAMGFCFFNNVAVGVARALDHGGVERIAVLDFDVHYGNGTEDVFRNDARVLVCSSYQHPLYPYSGCRSIDGHLVNVPLAPGSGSRTFRRRIEEEWLPPLESFAPQLIFFSAGFDGHHEDTLADLNLTEADFAWVTELGMDVADRHGDGRIVSVLEGGYALSALGRSAAAHVKTLLRA